MDLYVKLVSHFLMLGVWMRCVHGRPGVAVNKINAQCHCSPSGTHPSLHHRLVSFLLVFIQKWGCRSDICRCISVSRTYPGEWVAWTVGNTFPPCWCLWTIREHLCCKVDLAHASWMDGCMDGWAIEISLSTSSKSTALRS